MADITARQLASNMQGSDFGTACGENEEGCEIFEVWAPDKTKYVQQAIERAGFEIVETSVLVMFKAKGE